MIEAERARSPINITQADLAQSVECSCGDQSCPQVLCLVRAASCHQGFLNRDTKEAASIKEPGWAMSEGPWTEEENKMFCKEVLVEAARDVLQDTKTQSHIQVKTLLAQRQLKVMKKMYRKEKQRMREMGDHTSCIKKIIEGLGHILHQTTYPLDMIRLVHKEEWNPEELQQAQGYLLEVLRFREMKEAVLELLKFLMDTIMEREKDIMELEEAILEHQQIEVRLRVTPVDKESNLRISSLSLRPGEKQVTINKERMVLEEAVITDAGRVVLVENQKLRKVAQVAETGEPLISHRILYLKREDMEEDQDEVPVEQTEPRIMALIRLARTPNPAAQQPPN